jgi:hypothetical protein
MCTRYACFRQETVEAGREEQLRITGFQYRRGIFGLSKGMFVSQREMYYGICWLEKNGNLSKLRDLKKNIKYIKTNLNSFFYFVTYGMFCRYMFQINLEMYDVGRQNCGD